MKFTVGCIVAAALANTATAVTVERVKSLANVVSKKQLIVDETEFEECMKLSGLEGALPCFKELGKSADQQIESAIQAQVLVAFIGLDLVEADAEFCKLYQDDTSFQCFQQESIAEPYIKFWGQLLTDTVNEGCGESVKALAALIQEELEDGGEEDEEVDPEEIVDSVALASDDITLDKIQEIGAECEKISPGISTANIPNFAGNDDSSAVLPAASAVTLLLAVAQAM